MRILPKVCPAPVQVACDFEQVLPFEVGLSTRVLPRSVRLLLLLLQWLR